MTSFKIELTDEAIDNLEQIYLYIAEELKSKVSAKKQYERIVNQIMKLETFPERYHILEYDKAYSRGMRMMPIDNYAIIYIVRQKRVIITNILYGASDIRTKLKE
ncbi:MAG: type II toxin-antitoxin system RelE/ParE family toxin [Clostridiales bacterium]|nr:type II toxin-antitoxin system RelE/ParE family toxin [Clostridiales bacterium]